MRKLFLAFFCLALVLLFPLYGMAESEDILTFEDNTPYLFGEIRPLMSANQVSDLLSGAGYSRTQNSIYAFLPNQWVFQASSKEPYLVVLIVDEETNHITDISLMYSTSGDTFSNSLKPLKPHVERVPHKTMPATNKYAGPLAITACLSQGT